ncbi:cytochrome c peroxidase [Photobacterium minamisatsumaniensis]|uniref:cytochrome c peroxidase n=1 Tax=Photobacterium minamisatsumaniensis TaxID=2910233 RepID=UPI003D0F9718
MINTKNKLKENKDIWCSTTLGLIVSLGLFPYGAHAIGDTPSFPTSNPENMTYLEEMGKRLFFTEISVNRNQSCASCHTGGTGGTNGDSTVNLGQVAVTGSDGFSVGSLKPPTNKYVQFLDKDGNVKGLANFDLCPVPFPPFAIPCGGAFWNGRATGDLLEQQVDVFASIDNKYYEMYNKYLGPMADQAHASPFINPVEQALPNMYKVCKQVKQTLWGPQLYQYAWGKKLRCSTDSDVQQAFGRFAVSLASWQMSSDNNPFDSKRDIALAKEIQKAEDSGNPISLSFDDFSPQENFGRFNFYVKARCNACHVSDGDPTGIAIDQRYSNDRYFNIGVPRNHEIPNDPEPNEGVFAITFDPNFIGQHKVPTLRNVDKRPHAGFSKAYTHNGWFKTLEQLVHFYNTADVDYDPVACANAPDDDAKMAISTACFFEKTRCVGVNMTVEEAMADNCWPDPEFSDTRPPSFIIGDLKLTTNEELAIVAYLKTLSDTSEAKSPSQYMAEMYKETRLEHQPEDDSGYEEPAPVHTVEEPVDTRHERPTFTRRR